MKKLYLTIMVAMTAALMLSACGSIAAFTSSGGTAEDIPFMADARDRGFHGGQTLYASPSQFKDVVAFYEKEMKANGWTETEGSKITNRQSSKYYIKDGRTVWVVIFDDRVEWPVVMAPPVQGETFDVRGAGKTTVMIMEEKK